MKNRAADILQWGLIAAGVAGAIVLVNRVGIEQIRAQVEQLGVWAPLLVFGLRFTSIIVPILPGTAYAVLAGGLFGFWQGLGIVAIADFLACSFNFWVARRYGRGLVERFVGQQFMEKVDRLGQRHLERNFFLMAGLLMIGLFDFSAYAIGLTQVRWQSYLLALLISIAIAKPLWVAAGAGIFEGSQMLLGFAALAALGVGTITTLVQRDANSEEKSK